MRILIIGGSGFIGRHLVARLRAAGHQIGMVHRGTTPTPDGVLVIPADRHRLTESRDPLRRFAPDVVIDMILSSARQAGQTVELFRGVARRLVVASSMDVYRAVAVLHGLEPGPPDPVPLTEDSPLRTVRQTYPPDLLRELTRVFGWLDEAYDKVEVERAVAGVPDLPATVLRLPMVYGPGDPLHRLHPLLKRMDDGRPVILFDEQTARWRSPRGYVENVAEAIALAATAEPATGRTYNVAEPESLSELAWALEVAEAAGWGGQLAAIPRDRTPAHLVPPGNLEQHWSVDSSRIRDQLGYREPFSRREAVRRTVAWERAHPPPSIDPTRFDYAAEDAALS